jgi:hypothetical protein
MKNIDRRKRPKIEHRPISLLSKISRSESINFLRASPHFRDDKMAAKRTSAVRPPRPPPQGGALYLPLRYAQISPDPTPFGSFSPVSSEEAPPRPPFQGRPVDVRFLSESFARSGCASSFSPFVSIRELVSRSVPFSNGSCEPYTPWGTSPSLGHSWRCPFPSDD